MYSCNKKLPITKGTDIAAVHAPPQYRIALFHLKWMSKKQLTKLLNNNEITFRSVKLIPHNNMAYIGFDDQEIMNKALQFLNGYKHKGEQLVAEQAEQGVKRKRDSDDQEPSKGILNSIRGNEKWNILRSLLFFPFIFL